VQSGESFNKILKESEAEVYDQSRDGITRYIMYFLERLMLSNQGIGWMTEDIFVY